MVFLLTILCLTVYFYHLQRQERRHKRHGTVQEECTYRTNVQWLIILILFWSDSQNLKVNPATSWYCWWLPFHQNCALPPGHLLLDELVWPLNHPLDCSWTCLAEAIVSFQPVVPVSSLVAAIRKIHYDWQKINCCWSLWCWHQSHLCTTKLLYFIIQFCLFEMFRESV